eukprot:CAMPEP_0175123092 /NCGR_PEP_ID=MMETSP0087-20121206/2059_1 /TAXON_ID=136419 /ORGANISM="Unknown Unknown, Strain D1" /LENGTH=1672 /DNA_ID=CAMNT_0016404761 /DNA_START=177 /DNA_END=5195 /DNA_ORIENTATION=-
MFFLLNRAGVEASCLVFAPATKHRKPVVIAAMLDSTIRSFDPDSCTCVETLKSHGHVKPITSISFSSSGTLMLTTSQDCAVLWRNNGSSAGRWNKVRTLNHPTAHVSQAMFVPDNNALLVAFSDDSLLLWKWEGRDVKALSAKPYNLAIPKADLWSSVFIKSVAISSNARYLIAVGKCSSAYLWELSLQTFLRAIELPKQCTGASLVAFVPDTNLVCVLCDDGAVYVFDVLTLRVALTLPSKLTAKNGARSPRDKVTSFALSGSGQYLSLLTSTGAVHLHDLAYALEYQAKVTFAKKEASKMLQGDVLRALTKSNNRAMAGPVHPIAAPATLEVPSPHKHKFAPSSSVVNFSTVESLPSDSTENSVINDSAPAESNSLTDVQADTAFEAALTEARHEARQLPRSLNSSAALSSAAATAAQSVASEHTLSQDAPQLGPGVDLSNLKHLEALHHLHSAQEPAQPQDSWSRGKEAEVQAAPVSEARIGQLSELNPGLSMLNSGKLQQLLKTYGTYPDKYRVLIWSYLLKLPGNKSASQLLLSKGPHKCVTRILAASGEPMPFHQAAKKTPRDSKLLKQVMSALAHWSPIFTEVTYLPTLLAPFLRVFKDTTSALEVSLTVLTNWASGWFEHFPSLPVRVLAVVEDLVRLHDAGLWTHLRDVVGSLQMQELCWGLLSSFLSSVLTLKEWLQVADHVLSSTPSFLLAAVAAYLVLHRAQLLTATCHGEIDFFLRHKNPVKVNELVAEAYKMLSSSPDSVFASVPAFEPLPQHAYPIFSKFYPKYVVDFHLQERQLIQQEEEQMAHKREMVADIQKRTAELAYNQSKWKAQHSYLLQAEEARRQKAMREDTKRAKEARALDLQTNQRRLEQIMVMEKSCREYMIQDELMQQAELLRVEEELQRKASREQTELESRKEHENLLKLEWEVSQRVRELSNDKARKLTKSAIRAEVDAKLKAREIEDALTKQKWREEDEARRIKAQADAEKRKELEAFNKGLEAKQKVQKRLMLEDLRREAEIGALEKARRLRQMEEDQANLVEQSVRREVERKRLLEKEEERMYKSILQQEQDYRISQQKEQQAFMENAAQSAKEADQRRRERLEEFEYQQRIREFTDELHKFQAETAEKFIREEETVKATVRQLEEASQSEQQLQLSVQVQRQRMKEQLKVQKAEQEAEQRMLLEERQKFLELKEALGTEMTQLEEAMVHQYEAQLEELRLERQKRLLTLQSRYDQVLTQNMKELEAKERHKYKSRVQALQDKLAQSGAMIMRERAQNAALLHRTHHVDLNPEVLLNPAALNASTASSASSTSASTSSTSDTSASAASSSSSAREGAKKRSASKKKRRGKLASPIYDTTGLEALGGRFGATLGLGTLGNTINDLGALGGRLHARQTHPGLPLPLATQTGVTLKPPDSIIPEISRLGSLDMHSLGYSTQQVDTYKHAANNTTISSETSGSSGSSSSSGSSHPQDIEISDSSDLDTSAANTSNTSNETNVTASETSPATSARASPNTNRYKHGSSKLRSASPMSPGSDSSARSKASSTLPFSSAASLHSGQSGTTTPANTRGGKNVEIYSDTSPEPVDQSEAPQATYPFHPAHIPMNLRQDEEQKYREYLLEREKRALKAMKEAAGSEPPSSDSDSDDTDPGSSSQTALSQKPTGAYARLLELQAKVNAVQL